MSSSTPPVSPERDGFSPKRKLQLVELVGFALMVAGAVRVAFGYWGQGVPVLLLGAFMLLQPTQVVQLIERVFPPGG